MITSTLIQKLLAQITVYGLWLGQDTLRVYFRHSEDAEIEEALMPVEAIDTSALPYQVKLTVRDVHGHFVTMVFDG
ncbi:hypothetical protein AK812_SmicGene16612 [Symbiodinium microadriaticum]|uniref:Uncharacterized protein n=1 Tax=Symbiodinium microadriaticum TaxID=2951 RepID=A0A1Q9DZT9_SYMMI|nr:hypothetical protein AK812_SmicGene16612 [Symbiodinium microadriaticum]